MRHIIENILKVNPNKVELSLVDYQDEGIKLEAFLLDENYNVIDVFTVSSDNTGKLVNIMRELCTEINKECITCECIDGIQKC